ncbi:hypothetical protein DP120_08665 [Planococcus halotolerans]|uniref:Uncharacterized protein n=1 Tax=Planococcus halotolerans TaxID=2233542 RepID=A0A365L2K4_9BACL|nr:hypothetical protein DP120_08665 [Planococcus halotolerans]
MIVKQEIRKRYNNLNKKKTYACKPVSAEVLGDKELLDRKNRRKSSSGLIRIIQDFLLNSSFLFSTTLFYWSSVAPSSLVIT